MRRYVPASVVEAHAHLVRLSVELTLNHPLERPLIELVRRVEQVLGIEVAGPVLRERVGAAEIHGGAGSVPNVARFLAADKKQVRRCGIGDDSQSQSVLLVEGRDVPGILRGRRQRREFAGANLDARIDEGVVCAGAEPAQKARQLLEALFPVEFRASRVGLAHVAERKEPQRVSYSGKGRGTRLAGHDIVLEFLVEESEREYAGVCQILFNRNVA